MNGQSSISDTVNRTGLAQSRVSTSVANLRERGRVKTSPTQTGGRKTLATATQAVKLEGDRRRARSAGDTLARVRVDADAKERQTLTRALERLHQLLRDPNTTTELRTLKANDARHPNSARAVPVEGTQDRTAQGGQTRSVLAEPGRELGPGGDDRSSSQAVV